MAGESRGHQAHTASTLRVPSAYSKAAMDGGMGGGCGCASRRRLENTSSILVRRRK